MDETRAVGADGFAASAPAHPKRGFLPEEDPCLRLPAAFAPWDELGRDLPGLLAAGRARERIEQLPVLEVAPLQDPRHLERAMMLLSFFGHAAVWEKGRQQPQLSFPRSVAVPWVQVARRLGRPPVLSYSSHALNNWRRVDAEGPIALGNLLLQQAFLGGLDESWFILVHVELEARGAPLVSAAAIAQEAVVADRPELLLQQLRRIASAQQEMERVLMRMTEHCEPSIFFRRIQPFLHGFLQLPVRYEGVPEFGDQPQPFAGASAAQSVLLPLLDAVLGVRHSEDTMYKYLLELRRYFPPAHQAFLESVERGPSIRDYLLARRPPELVEVYNACVELLGSFRQKHMEMTARYIIQPAREHATAQGGSHDQGTGGTPFTHYLKKHRDETHGCLIR
jgi:indoleamine 2,3-dioxygenase